MSQEHEIGIDHRDSPAGGEFVVERETVTLAEMVYRRSSARLINVVHTRVEEQLRGHGVARRLLDALVAWARTSHTRVTATCPYARAQFEKDSSIQDVYDAQ